MHQVRRGAGAFALALAACLGGIACSGTPADLAAAAKPAWLGAYAAFDTSLIALAAAATGPIPADSLGATGARLRAGFAVARDRYKRAEALLEYFAPAASRRINGPPLPWFEEDAPLVKLPAEGLQVVEGLLYPEVSDSAALLIPQLTARMRGHLARGRQVLEASPVTTTQAWDLARLEVIRLSAFSLGGVDSPAAERTATEIARAIEGVGAVLEPWRGPLDRTNLAAGDTLRSALAAAVAAADRPARAGVEFDRLGLLVGQLIPLSHAIAGARAALGVPAIAARSLLREGAASPYDSGAFDPGGFRTGHAVPVDSALVTFGGRLFSDKALSGDGSRSCASCHVPALAFADGRARSTAFAGSGAQLRNAPSLINASLQGAQFLDGRVTYLEDQVAQVVANRNEMHGSVDASSAQAIAEFVRSLVALDAPFDRYVRGDRSALTDAQHRGFNVFMGRAKCGSCHFPPLFNGTVPPSYSEQEYEVIGSPEFAGSHRVDPDRGREAVSGSPLQRFAFRTSSVRNSAVTAPYMHNGAFRTLDEVIDFYEKGGSAGIGRRLDNQTLPFDRLNLSAQDKMDLKRFIESLTDTVVRRPALHAR